ncbi:MAG: hypothetical protein NTX46_05540 [Chloroflexi bacterium]|nr:hypothetical protein [Chloroflexota bacterium]
METERVIDGGVTLAIIIRGKDWEPGLNFVSSEADYQQVGIWGYDKGKVLNPHIHLVAPRESLHTQEVVFIKNGSIRANIYNTNKKFLKSVELEQGDTIILLNGGHGYEILEDNTSVLEVKNGPYVGPEKDREII